MRSFVRRQGRTTRAQARAMAELWPRFGIAYAPEFLDLDEIFGRRAPRTLEIGFGNGDALVARAAARPGEDFIGAEVHEPGVGHCLLALERHGLGNVRLVAHDALEVLGRQVAPGSLAAVHLFFPDPWPKKRHHKRRIVQPAFLALVASRLAPGGVFRVATDWPPYAEHIEEVVTASGLFGPGHPPGDDDPRARTRFEARGDRLGHPIWERLYPVR